MLGYFLLQALENELPGHRVISLICQTEVAIESLGDTSHLGHGQDFDILVRTGIRGVPSWGPAVLAS